MNLREMWNGIRHGSPEGPYIVLHGTIDLHNMSERRASRLVRMIREGGEDMGKHGDGKPADSKGSGHKSGGKHAGTVVKVGSGKTGSGGGK